MDKHPAGPPASTGSDTADLLPGGRPRTVSSTELLKGSRVVEICHNGEVYRLQSTRLGKLILTK